ncbi:hypothetical protein JCM11641_002603 [Rhodosporidiobolus odoratus]
MTAVQSLDPPTLERIFHYAGQLDQPLNWISPPAYTTLKHCSLVQRTWRSPAQAVLLKHIRIATSTAMQAVRSRDVKRVLADHPGKTQVVEVEYQWGMDVYWLLDRFPRTPKGGLKAFKLVYDPTRGNSDGQAERDEEWLEWEVLRHPSLAGITNLFCKADLRDPADLSLLNLPLTHLSLGNLPLHHSPNLHKAIFTGSKEPLRSVALDFSPLNHDKVALDGLIEEFQVIAATLEHLYFLNKPNINFLMSLHSKMNATKMPLFYSSTYPLIPNALAPFNILALAVVNNGTSLAEFRFAEADPRNPANEEEHEALVLKYISAFGSRLDSFNMLGRRFTFVFPREWSARFVKKPEIARFLDRAGMRGCDVQCGKEQKFLSTAKAMEKRKGKRVAADGGEESTAAEDEPTQSVEQAVGQAMAIKKDKGKGKAVDKSKGKANDKGKGKAVDKGKGKAVETAKAKSVDRKGKGKAVA